MPPPSDSPQVPPAYAWLIDQVNVTVGSDYRWLRRLPGGEQGGAHLVVEDGRAVVLKWEPAGWKADQLIGAFPAVTHATDHGWPAARWLRCGRLAGGEAFLLQEQVPGDPLSRLGAPEVRAVVAANARQTGLALAGARDDSSQLEAVLRGDHEWKAWVADFTPAGAALVRHGDEVIAWAGQPTLPTTDVVHGDYSSSNLLLHGEVPEVTFVDCAGAGRGTRVRDLADLYRQGFVYPSPHWTGLSRLGEAGAAVAGPQVFAGCVVAVTYNNLAWWVEHQPPDEFDRACGRLHRLFDALTRRERT